MNVRTIVFLHLQLMGLHSLPILELHEYPYGTCSNALIAEKDNFHMYGSLNLTSEAQGWSQYLTILYRHASTNNKFEPMCMFDTRTTDSTNGCNCYDCLSDFKQFKINKTAKLEYSDAEIRAVMPSLKVKGEFIYSPIRRLPPVTTKEFEPVRKPCIAVNTEENHLKYQMIIIAVSVAITSLISIVTFKVVRCVHRRIRKNKDKKEWQKEETDTSHLNLSYSNGFAVAPVQDNIGKEQSEAGIDSTKMFLRCSEVA